MIIASIAPEQWLLASVALIGSIITGVCATWLTKGLSLGNWRKQQAVKALAKYCAEIEHDLRFLDFGYSMDSHNAFDHNARRVAAETRIRILERDSQLAKILSNLTQAVGLAQSPEEVDSAKASELINKAYDRLHVLYFQSLPARLLRWITRR